ncbi:DUF4232 domain-containing protein [Streptomyces sp. NPDC001848]|uniref:DUF4232 domain-containing protein n=1 Tax=Streptomyces sp. NPDC001848 TaxID=3364618 RepID=UPI003678963F
MSSARTARPIRAARPRLLAAVTVALAALALSACENGEGVRDEGPSSLPGSSVHDTGRPDRAVPCSGRHMRTAVTRVSEPVNHLLLTVTNTGAVNCSLNGYPMARFGESGLLAPPAGGPKPRGHWITLSPGKSAYAGVLLSAANGTGGHGHTVTSLTITLPTGPAARPSLPSKGVYVDDTLRVTCWLPSPKAALTY